MHHRALLLIFVCAATGLWASTAATAKGTGKRIIARKIYDPAAPVVELFEGVEQGEFEVRLIPKNSTEGSVLIENMSDRAITVKLPPAVAAVQVLKQGFGGAGAGAGGRGGIGQPGGAGGGQGQALGGGFGGGGFGAGGGGFFTIPAEKTARVPLVSVCLNHGKPEPRPSMTYRLVPLETYTGDKALRALLVAVGTGTLDASAAQAAAWHLTDKMTWEELSQKTIERLGGVEPDAYFSAEQIAAARDLVAAAQSAGLERGLGGEAPRPQVREEKKR